MASVPVQVKLLWQVLVLLPFNIKPSLHVKLQVSPSVGTPSSPSEQLISPLSGASSRGHCGTKM